MTKNVGLTDRVARGFAAARLGLCAIFAPLPFWVRVAGLGLNTLHLGYTALSGTCLGYRDDEKSSTSRTGAPARRDRA